MEHFLSATIQEDLISRQRLEVEVEVEVKIEWLRKCLRENSIRLKSLKATSTSTSSHSLTQSLHASLFVQPIAQSKRRCIC